MLIYYNNIHFFYNFHHNKRITLYVILLNCNGSKEVCMLGLGDVWVFMAYLLCIASAILCAVYGFIKWNDDEEPYTDEAKRWAEEEAEIEKTL